MRRSLLVFLTLIVLSACATLVTGRPEYQQLLVTQRYDAAYLRAQAVAVGLGLQIIRTQDSAHIFTAKRPVSGGLLPISQLDLPKGICYTRSPQAWPRLAGCRGETAVLLHTMCCTIPLVMLVDSWSKESLQDLCFDSPVFRSACVH